MTISTMGNSATDLVLADLIDEAMKKLKAGEPLDLEAYASEHPDCAEQLEELLPALELLSDLSEGLGRAGFSSKEVPDAAPLDGPSGPFREVLGDFRIKREIGRGGMGVVYEAEQTSLNRRVALKMFPFAAVLAPKQLLRF